MASFVERLKDVIRMVKYLMAMEPDTKNSKYNFLVLKYWELVDGIKIPPDLIRRLSEATSCELITRARRDVQKRDKYYQPTQEAREARQKVAEQARLFFGGKQGEEMVEA